jgi:Probable Zinc-ribbon domain
MSETSLSKTHPEIAAEWHPEKNDRTPDDVTFGSTYSAVWICSLGHEWRTSVGNRTSGKGCRVCWYNNTVGEGNPKWKGIGEMGATYWSTLLHNANKRNLEISIDPAYAWDLFLKQEQKCALSGRPLVMSAREEMTASLDRIDSTKGYVPGNVQWIHKKFQIMKWNIPQDEFVLLCEEVSRYAYDKASHTNPKITGNGDTTIMMDQDLSAAFDRGIRKFLERHPELKKEKGNPHEGQA